MMRITFVGDIFPGNMPYNTKYGIGQQMQKDYGNYLSIKKFFEGSDVIAGNLEAPLICPSDYQSKLTFAGNSYFAKYLRECGFDLVSIANNHILEHGMAGFESTMKILNNEGIKYIGKNVDGKSNIFNMQFGDISVCVAAFNDIYDKRLSNTYAEFSETSILATIKEMDKYDPSFKILSFHWGNEYIHLPSHRQINMSRKFIDNGVDVIIGHHPHVIQPFEKYKKGLIFYSLGNFMFDMIYSKNVRSGILVHLDLHRNQEIEHEIVPITIDRNFIPQQSEHNILYNNILEDYSHARSTFYDKSVSHYEFFFNKKSKRRKLIQRLRMKKDLIRGIIRRSFSLRQFIFGRIT